MPLQILGYYKDISAKAMAHNTMKVDINNQMVRTPNIIKVNTTLEKEITLYKDIQSGCISKAFGPM